MFLQDRPEDSDIRFGHHVLAKWLAHRVVEAPSPYRLGITAQLGTGKSTIVEKAVEYITEEIGAAKVRTAFVDVWKLDKENVRRSALIKISKDLLDDDNFLTTQKSLVYESITEENKDRTFKYFIDKKLLAMRFAAVFFGFFFLCIAANSELRYGPALLVSFITALLDLSQNFFKTILVRNKTTSSRSPWIGSEEFEEGLQQVIEHPSLKEKQVLIIFDNIDRAHGESTKSILSGISAFFDHSHKDRIRNVKIIVPYDPSCLANKIDSDRPLIDDCEKMFDAIVTLPKLTREDLTDFASDKYKDCLSDFKFSTEVHKDLAILTDQSPYNSPRSIKHLVNQFSALFNLASFFENNVDDRISGSPTLLPEGTITHHPVAMLKFLICDKIAPGFLNKVVSLGTDPKVLFEDQEFIKTTFPDSKALADFLSATRGTPTVFPSSSSPFLFLKGPDQVLSISSGVALSNALYSNNSEQLKEITYAEGNRKISDSDFEAILRFHKTKFSSNKQVIRNTVFGFLDLFADEEKIEKGLSQELCDLILEIPDQFSRIDLSVLGKLTKDYKNLDKTQKIWNIAFADFKSKLTDEILREPEQLDWSAEFYLQAKKHSFVNFDETLSLPLRLVLHDRVYSSFENLNTPLLSNDSVMTAAKLLLNQDLAQSNETKIMEIVRVRFSSIDEKSFQSLQPMFTEKYNYWKKLKIDWNSETNGEIEDILYGKEGEKLSTLLASWPTSLTPAKTEFDAICSSLVNDHSNLINKSAENSRDVLKIAGSVYLGGYGAHHHIDQYLQTALTSLKEPQDFETVIDFFADYDIDVFIKKLIERCGTQFLSAIEKLNLVQCIWTYLDSKKFFLDFVLSNIDKLPNQVEAIIQLIPKLDSEEEIRSALGLVASKIDFVKGSKRLSFIDMLYTHELKDALKNSIENFIIHPDDTSDELRSRLLKMDATLVREIVDFSEVQIKAKTSVWTEKEVA